MMLSECLLDEGTEWVVGCSIESVDSWAAAPSTESMDSWVAAPSSDFSLSLVTKNVLYPSLDLHMECYLAS